MGLSPSFPPQEDSPIFVNHGCAAVPAKIGTVPAFDSGPYNCYKAIMSRAKPKSSSMLTDVLRAAVGQSGLSQYRIARDTGIVPTSLMRFMRGETSLRLDKADALAAYLQLELVKKRKERSL